MSAKAALIVVCVIVATVVTTTKIVVPKIKEKRTVDESVLGSVLVWVMIPILAGLLATYISNHLFPDVDSEWKSNITTIDEEILKNNDCEDLDDYYVRIFESDRKLSTGNVSTYLKRIETSNKVKSEVSKYRYIEAINKVEDTSPKVVIYQKNDDGSKEVLHLENTHGEYSEKAYFYSRTGANAKYYLYSDIKIEDDEIDFDNLESILNERISIDYFDFKKLDGKTYFLIDLYSTMTLPIDEVGDGFNRVYIGKVNNCLSEEGSLYHYQQVKEVKNSELPKIIPIIEEKDFPDEFKHQENFNQRMILATSIPQSTEKVNYEFTDFFYMMKDSIESTQTMYKFNEYTRVQ